MKSAPLTRDTVLLFYQDFAEKDRWIPGDRYPRRLLRPLVRRIVPGPKVSGFLVAYQGLARALRRAGVDVRENDRALALRNPDHPVGIAGYPEILNGWDLPNPAILGPGLLDHPSERPELMQDPRFRYYISSCEWEKTKFRRWFGDATMLWYAGLDLDEWPDTRGNAKDIDVLVYDKIRWNREELVPALLDPVLERLRARGLRVEVIRYRKYDHETYRALLARSRSMLFLCEHETQGLAYQEAMAAGVPILAWDNGFWLDPNRPRWEPEPVPASSVPYFSPECGERFKDLDEFDAAMDRFWSRLDGYDPRGYVARELSEARSAELYLSRYRSLLPRAKN